MKKSKINLDAEVIVKFNAGEHISIHDGEAVYLKVLELKLPTLSEEVVVHKEVSTKEVSTKEVNPIPSKQVTETVAVPVKSLYPDLSTISNKDLSDMAKYPTEYLKEWCISLGIDIVNKLKNKVRKTHADYRGLLIDYKESGSTKVKTSKDYSSMEEIFQDALDGEVSTEVASNILSELTEVEVADLSALLESVLLEEMTIAQAIAIITEGEEEEVKVEEAPKSPTKKNKSAVSEKEPYTDGAKYILTIASEDGETTYDAEAFKKDGKWYFKFDEDGDVWSVDDPDILRKIKK